MKTTTKICILTLVACIGLTLFLGKSEAQQKPKDVLFVAQEDDVTTFDPSMSTHVPNVTFYNVIYDCLTIFDNVEFTKLNPALATSWNLINPTTWQFKLRKGVTFHDGEPFNANTVKFNVEWLKTPGKHTVAGNFQTIDHAEVVDDYTINIITKGPDSLLPKRLGAYGAQMTPPEYIKKVGRQTLNSKPIGTGPYIMKEWVKDDHVTLERNEKYWGEKGVFKEVIVKALPDNLTRLNAVLTGEVDLASMMLPDQAAIVGSGNIARIESVLAAAQANYGFSCSKGPLKNKLVRQACNYAVDKDAILKKLWKGYGKVSTGSAITYDFGYDPGLKPYPYDPAKARELIKQAGYKPGEISFDLYANAPGKELTEIVCAYLNDVGINAQPKVLEAATRARWQSDAYLWQGGVLFYPSSTLYDLDGSLWRTHGPKGAGANRWEEMNKPGMPFHDMMEKARYSLNQEERRKIYIEANKIFRDEAPVLFLFQYKILYGVNNRINYRPRPDERMYYNLITFR